MSKLSKGEDLLSGTALEMPVSKHKGHEEAEMLVSLLQSPQPDGAKKQLAGALLTEFGSLREIVFSPAHALQAQGVCDFDIASLRQASRLVQVVLRSELAEQPLLNNLERVKAYCHLCLAGKTREQFDCLFMDKSLRFKAHSCLQVGTTDHVAVYPRELIGEALRHHASALILVHNHPSANAEPSRADISMTKSLIKIGKSLGIAVTDHIIVSRKEVFSFKQAALI